MCPGVTAVRDLYAVLNLKPNANLNEVRAAYRRAALISHPDKGGTSQAFHIVKFAFEVLSCSVSRRLYDSTYAYQSEVHRCSASATSTQVEESASKGYNVDEGFGARNCLKRSRPRSWLGTAQAQSKRARHCDPTEPAGKPHNVIGKAPMRSKQVMPVEAALERLRVVLQSMSPPQRSAALQKIDPRVASSLFDFMKKGRRARSVASRSDGVETSSACFHNLQKQMHVCGLGTVNILKNEGGTRYRTQLVIRGMRLYTLAKRYEDAIDHHIILVHMRDAIATASRADSSLWTNPTKLLGLLNTALGESGTSEQNINLHAFVYTKAAPWLHQSTPITSPVLPLCEAVSVYTRLLSAQSASWERLRAEWVSLLQRQRRGRAQARQSRSKADAEAIADSARQNALSRQLKHAELGVKCAVRNGKARTAALKREAIRRHREQLRQPWMRRKDLTMEDILGGGCVQE